jgi:hypothetical protein
MKRINWKRFGTCFCIFIALAFVEFIITFFFAPRGKEWLGTLLLSPLAGIIYQLMPYSDGPPIIPMLAQVFLYSFLLSFRIPWRLFTIWLLVVVHLLSMLFFTWKTFSYDIDPQDRILPPEQKQP